MNVDSGVSPDSLVMTLSIWALEYVSDNEMSPAHTKPVSHVLSVGEQVSIAIYVTSC